MEIIILGSENTSIIQGQISNRTESERCSHKAECKMESFCMQSPIDTNGL